MLVAQVSCSDENAEADLKCQSPKAVNKGAKSKRKLQGIENFDTLALTTKIFVSLEIWCTFLWACFFWELAVFEKCALFLCLNL